MLPAHEEAQVSKRVLALVLLAVLGAVSVFVTRPRAVQAQVGTCSVPKSAGTYRGGSGAILTFEAANGTISVYDVCNLKVTVTRQ